MAGMQVVGLRHEGSDINLALYEGVDGREVRELLQGAFQVPTRRVMGLKDPASGAVYSLDEVNRLPSNLSRADLVLESNGAAAALAIATAAAAAAAAAAESEALPAPHHHVLPPYEEGMGLPTAQHRQLQAALAFGRGSRRSAVEPLDDVVVEVRLDGQRARMGLHAGMPVSELEQQLRMLFPEGCRGRSLLGFRQLRLNPYPQPPTWGGVLLLAEVCEDPLLLSHPVVELVCEDDATAGDNDDDTAINAAEYSRVLHVDSYEGLLRQLSASRMVVVLISSESSPASQWLAEILALLSITHAQRLVFVQISFAALHGTPLAVDESEVPSLQFFLSRTRFQNLVNPSPEEVAQAVVGAENMLLMAQQQQEQLEEVEEEEVEVAFHGLPKGLLSEEEMRAVDRIILMRDGNVRAAYQACPDLHLLVAVFLRLARYNTQRELEDEEDEEEDEELYYSEESFDPASIKFTVDLMATEGILSEEQAEILQVLAANQDKLLLDAVEAFDSTGDHVAFMQAMLARVAQQQQQQQQPLPPLPREESEQKQQGDQQQRMIGEMRLMVERMEAEADRVANDMRALQLKHAYLQQLKSMVDADLLNEDEANRLAQFVRDDHPMTQAAFMAYAQNRDIIDLQDTLRHVLAQAAEQELAAAEFAEEKHRELGEQELAAREFAEACHSKEAWQAERARQEAEAGGSPAYTAAQAAAETEERLHAEEVARFVSLLPLQEWFSPAQMRYLDRLIEERDPVTRAAFDVFAMRRELDDFRDTITRRIVSGMQADAQEQAAFQEKQQQQEQQQQQQQQHSDHAAGVQELQLVQALSDGDVLTPEEATFLQELITDQDEVVMAAFDLAFEDNDWEELYDTLLHLMQRRAGLAMDVDGGFSEGPDTLVHVTPLPESDQLDEDEAEEDESRMDPVQDDAGPQQLAPQEQDEEEAGPRQMPPPPQPEQVQTKGQVQPQQPKDEITSV